ncbi:MAG: hypothetical protein U0491_03770 [Candidatus Saccharimonadales bacterium]
MNQQKPNITFGCWYCQRKPWYLRKETVVLLKIFASAISEAMTEAERMAGIRINGATLNVNGAHIASQTSHGVVAISSQPGKLLMTIEAMKKLQRDACQLAVKLSKFLPKLSYRWPR